MNIITHLGEKLADLIHISQPAARGLIKLALKEQLGPFKPLNQINYNDYNNTIENSLRERLINLNIDEVDEIIKTLVDELTLNQSLITLGGI